MAEIAPGLDARGAVAGEEDDESEDETVDLINKRKFEEFLVELEASLAKLEPVNNIPLEDLPNLKPAPILPPEKVVPPLEFQDLFEIEYRKFWGGIPDYIRRSDEHARLARDFAIRLAFVRLGQVGGPQEIRRYEELMQRISMRSYEATQRNQNIVFYEGFPNTISDFYARPWKPFEFMISPFHKPFTRLLTELQKNPQKDVYELFRPEMNDAGRRLVPIINASLNERNYRPTQPNFFENLPINQANLFNNTPPPAPPAPIPINQMAGTSSQTPLRLPPRPATAQPIPINQLAGTPLRLPSIIPPRPATAQPIQYPSATPLNATAVEPRNIFTFRATANTPNLNAAQAANTPNLNAAQAAATRVNAAGTASNFNAYQPAGLENLLRYDNESIDTILGNDPAPRFTPTTVSTAIATAASLLDTPNVEPQQQPPSNANEINYGQLSNPREIDGVGSILNNTGQPPPSTVPKKTPSNKRSKRTPKQPGSTKPPPPDDKKDIKGDIKGNFIRNKVYINQGELMAALERINTMTEACPYDFKACFFPHRPDDIFTTGAPPTFPRHMFICTEHLQSIFGISLQFINSLNLTGADCKMRIKDGPFGAAWSIRNINEVVFNTGDIIFPGYDFRKRANLLYLGEKDVLFDKLSYPIRNLISYLLRPSDKKINLCSMEELISDKLCNRADVEYLACLYVLLRWGFFGECPTLQIEDLQILGNEAFAMEVSLKIKAINMYVKSLPKSDNEPVPAIYVMALVITDFQTKNHGLGAFPNVTLTPNGAVALKPICHKNLLLWSDFAPPLDDSYYIQFKQSKFSHNFGGGDFIKPRFEETINEKGYLEKSVLGSGSFISQVKNPRDLVARCLNPGVVNPMQETILINDDEEEREEEEVANDAVGEERMDTEDLLLLTDYDLR